LRKPFQKLAVILVILVVPSMIFAASGHKFALGKVVAAEENQIVVPLVITNQDNLAAIDIPLKFSEGVTLKEVNFEDTRVSYFDLKIANINNDDRTVIIGLLPQMSPEYKPDLAAGTGSVANLVFEITDPTVSEIRVETFQTDKPNHDLMFVYHDYNQDGTPQIRVEKPEFEPVVVALSEVPSSQPNVPNTYALNQNYPNPFNPSTEISFDLPEPAHVTLTIYNVLGQEIETLVDREMEAGTQTVTWNAGAYSSGVYFYRLTTDKFTDTKKMLLLK
jgi:hypothetical protein